MAVKKIYVTCFSIDQSMLNSSSKTHQHQARCLEPKSNLKILNLEEPMSSFELCKQIKQQEGAGSNTAAFKMFVFLSIFLSSV